MQRLLIHIGSPKTGTSAIQEYLSGNAEELRGHGIHYPQTGRSPKASHHAHHNLGYSVYLPAKFRPEFGDWADVLEEIRASGAELGVISTESLFLAPAVGVDRVAELTRDFDVRIGAFLRRQDQHLESGYNQLVKFGRARPEDIGGFFERQRHVWNYRRAVEKWAGAFGPDRLVVIPFEPQNIRAGVAATLLERCGVPTDGLPAAERTLNTRVGLKAMTAVARVRARCKAGLGEKFEPSIHVVSSVVRRYRDHPDEIYDYSLLDYEAARRVYETYREGNRELAATVGAEHPEFFSSEPRPEEYPGLPGSAVLDPEEEEELDQMVDRLVWRKKHPQPS